MRTKTFAALLLLGAVAACDTDAPPGHGGTTLVEPPVAAAQGSCADLKALKQDARSYFSNPEQQEASDLLRTLEDACALGNHSAVESAAWAVLGVMEGALEDGVAGAPAIGAAVVAGRNASAAGLMDCIADDAGSCSPSADATSKDDVEAALGEYGTFTVRNGSSDYARARAALPWDTDELAWWGLEVDPYGHGVTWSEAIWDDATSLALLYGAPGDGGSGTSETPVSDIDDIDYDYHVFPHPDGGFAGKVYVGVCFSPLPTGADEPGMEPRIQRHPEGGSELILETYEPTFCPDVFPDLYASRPSSLKGVFAAAARFFLPEPLYAAVSHAVRSIGSSPSDFSNFLPVLAGTAGSLELLEGPPATVQPDQTISLVVQALSANGTPMELVPVEVYVAGNSGSPANAIFYPDSEDTYYTLEVTDAGDYGAVEITGSIPKTGGYTLCAKVPTNGYPGFTFQEACTQLFQVVPNG